MLDPRAFLINNKTGRVVATTFIEFLGGTSTTPSICFTDSPDSGLQCDNSGAVNYIKNGTNLGELGTPATLPLFTSTDAGLAPSSGGGTTNFLRADGTWAAPGGTPGGTSGQLQWNSSGSFAGVGGSTVGASGDITLSLNGAADTPPLKLTGTWFSGGTSTTTKPQLLIEPTGTTSTAWSTSGTGVGVNAPSGFTGNLLDLKNNGTSQFKVDTSGNVFLPDNSFIQGGSSDGLKITAGGIDILRNGDVYFSFDVPGKAGAALGSGMSLKWSNATTLFSTLDTGLKRDQAGVVAITDGSTGTGYLKQTPVAVSALPAAATVGAGTRGFVSDSTVAASGNFGATVTGGGSNNVPVFSDGTNWLIG